MKYLRNPALLLAAVLQVLPLARTATLVPQAGSTFAIIMRWVIGAAALEAYDSVSGSSLVYFTSPTNATGYVGSFFTFTNTLGGTIGTDPGGNISAAPLPPGLTNKSYDLYNANPPNVYGVISGVPTTPTNNMKVTVIATHPSFSGTVITNLYITITTGSAPVITNHPSPQTALAGGNASFSVGCSGGPLNYQWRREGSNLPGATAGTLIVSRVRLSQAGNYTVVVSNSINSVTSNPAGLVVNVPAGPQLSLAPAGPGQFAFAFAPVVGLTNSVQTNGSVGAGTWGVLTNIPPPATANPITLTNPINGPARFYRISFTP